MTLFGYEKDLYNLGVWPLERAYQRKSMTAVLALLDKFSFEAKKDACLRCRKNYKEIVRTAQATTRYYFNGLCLDCMDKTRPVTEDEHMDYWLHNDLTEADFAGHCRVVHGEPSWYFSFMGRLEVRDRFLRNRRMEKYAW